MTGERADPTVLREAAQSIGIALEACAAERLAAYLDAMLTENRAVNLTAVRELDQALVLHALDALAVGRVLDTPPAKLIDIGTGNGFPGVAAAALWPTCSVVLCDRTRKKLRAIGRALALSDVRATTLWLDVAQARALHPELLGSFDVVLARAVAGPEQVARLAGPLLGPGGRLLLWLTANDSPLPELPGGLRREVVTRYELPDPAPRSRILASWRAGS